MDGLSKTLLREMNITNLRTFLLPKGWTENRRYGFFISPPEKYPREQYWTADPDKLVLRRKIIFNERHPYVPGMSTWAVIWEAPWERLTFSSTGEVGVKAPKRRKTSAVIENNATGTAEPVDANK